MNGFRYFLEQLRFVIFGLTAAALPSPESRRFAMRWGVDVAIYSMIVGIVEATAGGLFFFFGAVAAVTGTSPLLGMTLLENWFPGLNPTHFMGVGLLALATWLAHPLAWVLALIGLTGIVRIVAFVAGRAPVGEPLVWALLRLGQFAHQANKRTKRSRDLGPLRPDRLEFEGDSGLRIISSRDRPEWAAGTTLEVAGRFFHFTNVEDVEEGIHRAVIYTFSEIEPNEVLRNPQPYQPLTDGVAGSPPTHE